MKKYCYLLCILLLIPFTAGAQETQKINKKNLVVKEWKVDGRSFSLMKNILLYHRVRSRRVSKYCIAVTMTDPGVRPGRFKQKVRIIEKIINKKVTAL